MAYFPPKKLCKAFADGEVNVIKSFLNSGLDPNVRVNYDSRTYFPLHLAVKWQHLDVVKLLLKYGANPNQLCGLGMSPLHLACSEDAEKIHLVLDRHRPLMSLLNLNMNFEIYKQFICDRVMMKILVDAGAKVNIKNSSGNTPMSCVFGVNYLEVFEGSLFPDFDYQVATDRVLIQGFRNRQKAKIDFLLSHGADVKATNKNGDTILHLVIKDMKGSRVVAFFEAMRLEDDVLAETIKIILKNGADVNAKNNQGQSPLHLAVTLMSFKIVKVLLDYNADLSDIQFDCFQYPENVDLCLHAADNLIKIVDALENNGYHLNQRKHLDILGFFANSNNKIPHVVSNMVAVWSKIRHLHRFGSLLNAVFGMDNNIWNGMICYNGDEKVSITTDNMIQMIADFLIMLNCTNLYANKPIKNFLSIKMKGFDPDRHTTPCKKKFISEATAKEIKEVKTIILSGSTSLYDVLNADPQNCYWRIKSSDYMPLINSEKFRDKFCYILHIMEGHLAKILVRRYVVESSRKYLAMLIDRVLPDLCRDKILDYLSNESLFNLCEAVIN